MLRKNENFSQKIKERLGGYGKYLLIVLIILLFSSLVKGIDRNIQIQKKIAKEKQEIEKLKKQNEELSLKTEEVKSQEFIEKQLREKLGLAKEGEIVIVLPDKEILRKIAPVSQEEEDVLPDPNWKKWLKLFL